MKFLCSVESKVSVCPHSQLDHVSNINGLSKRPLPNRLDRMVDQVALSYLADDNDVTPSRSRGKLL